MRVAQKCRPLALGGGALANDLDRVLAHHLGRTRKVGGQRLPVVGLPSLPDRVVACGGLAGVCARVCVARRIPVAPYVAPARKGRPRATKVSTVASRPMRTWSLGLSCAWCGASFPTGKRRDARHCGRCCGSAASRALRGFEARVGKAIAPAARGRVLALETKGWLRSDAIHAVYAATMIATEKARPLAEVKVKTPACRCGRAIASRPNAVTCGDAACRMKLLRRRRREEPRKARIRALFRVLLRSRRWRPFTGDEARAMGADLRVRARDVDELLRQLVEEDGTAFVLLGAPGVYAFVPPHAPRLAA